MIHIVRKRIQLGWDRKDKTKTKNLWLTSHFCLERFLKIEFRPTVHLMVQSADCRQATMDLNPAVQVGKKLSGQSLPSEDVLLIRASYDLLE